MIIPQKYHSILPHFCGISLTKNEAAKLNHIREEIATFWLKRVKFWESQFCLVQEEVDKKSSNSQGVAADSSVLTDHLRNIYIPSYAKICRIMIIKF